MAETESEKKDLTNLLELSQEMLDSQPPTDAAQAPENFLMEQPPLEKIDSFESLEEFSANPAMETETAPQTETPPIADLALPSLETPPQENTQATSAPIPSITPPEKSVSVLEEVQKFSQNLTVGKPAVAAEYPFSLMITGPLRPEEKDKILELISRHEMGIREIDLEPQWLSQRVLIPRISEYAGVILVQALRGSKAKIQLGPSDSIFSTPDTRSEDLKNSQPLTESSLQEETEHPAEHIPVSSQNKLPGLPHYTVIDTLTASATLKSKTVEAESSSEYQEILEALQRELKYKAYRKKATALVNFKISLTPLSSPTHYHLQVTAIAIVKSEKPAN